MTASEDARVVARTLTNAGIDPAHADALADAIRQAAEHQPVDFATRADLAAIEARLTWRFAGAMAAQTLTLIGAMVAIMQLIG